MEKQWKKLNKKSHKKLKIMKNWKIEKMREIEKKLKQDKRLEKYIIKNWRWKIKK